MWNRYDRGVNSKVMSCAHMCVCWVWVGGWNLSHVSTQNVTILKWFGFMSAFSVSVYNVHAICSDSVQLLLRTWMCYPTIITAVRIWLKSFTTSNSKQLLTLCFIHDALIGGWSSFDVKLLWDWIVSTYCWKIKAILWYELVLLHSQDQIPLDWTLLRRSNPVVEDRSLVSHDDVMELGNSWEFFKTVFMSKCGVTYDLECPF